MNFERFDNEDFLNRAYLDLNLPRIEGHKSFTEKD